MREQDGVACPGTWFTAHAPTKHALPLGGERPVRIENLSRRGLAPGYEDLKSCPATLRRRRLVGAVDDAWRWDHARILPAEPGRTGSPRPVRPRAWASPCPSFLSSRRPTSPGRVGDAANRPDPASLPSRARSPSSRRTCPPQSGAMPETTEEPCCARQRLAPDASTRSPY